MIAAMYLIAIGWIYVALMMALAEATHANGTVLGAIVTFFLYGVGPMALVIYLLQAPARRRALKARESADMAAAPELATTTDSSEPDAGSKTAADAVAPVRKEA